MRAVNLLPRDANRQKSSINAQNLPAVVGAGMGFVVIAILAATYLNAASKLSAAQDAYNTAKTQLAATPLPPSAPAQPTNTTPTAVASEQAPRLQAVSSVLANRIAWDRVLRQFSLVLPTDVWISSLTMSAPIAGATNGFSLSATTYSYDSVARMLSRMALIPSLTGVTLQSTAHSGRLVQFSIAASVKGAPAPPAPVAPAVPPTDTTQTGTTSTDSGASS